MMSALSVPRPSTSRVRGQLAAWVGVALVGAGGCTFDGPIERAYLESAGPDARAPLPEIPEITLNEALAGQLDCPAGRCQETYRIRVDGFGDLRVRVDATFASDDVTMRLTALDPVGSVIGQQVVESGKRATMKGTVNTGSYFLLVQSLGGAADYTVHASFDRRGTVKAPTPTPESYVPQQGGAADYGQPAAVIPGKLGAGFIRDPKVDFTKYKTFGFARNPAAVMSQAAPGQYVGSPFLDAEIHRAITYELMNWGFMPADDEKADVLISSHVGSQSRSVYAIDYVAYDVPYEALWNRWSYNAGAIVTPAIYTRGTLVIDVIDRKTTNLVWHGWSNRSISGRGDQRELVRDVVREILDQYRPKDE